MGWIVGFFRWVGWRRTRRPRVVTRGLCCAFRGGGLDDTAADAVADGAAIGVEGGFLFALAAGAGGGGHDGAGDGLGAATGLATATAATIPAATASAAGLGAAALGFLLLLLGPVDEVHDELVGGVADEGVDREAQ